MSSEHKKTVLPWSGTMAAALIGLFALSAAEPVYGVTRTEARRAFSSVNTRLQYVRRKINRLPFAKRKPWLARWNSANRDLVQARRNWSRKRYSSSVAWSKRAKSKLTRLEQNLAGASGTRTKPASSGSTSSGGATETTAKNEYRRASTRVNSLKAKLFKLAPTRRNRIYNRMAPVFGGLRRASAHLRAKRWSTSLAASRDVNRRMNRFEADYKRMMSSSSPNQRRDENLRRGCPRGEFYYSKQCHRFWSRAKMTYTAAKAYCKTRSSHLMYWRYIGARYVLQKGATAYEVWNISMENKPVWLGRSAGEKGPYYHGVVVKGKAKKYTVPGGSTKAYAFCSARNSSSRNKKFR